MVVGVDISYTRLSRAQHKTMKYSSYALFIQAYAEALPLKKKMFDGAVCTEVLEHVIHDDALLEGLSSVLKPNAWVLLSIPTVSLSRYFEMWYMRRPIYCDPIEHIREFTYYKIPWFENNFILINKLEKKFIINNLNIMKRYGIGFELPLGLTKFKFGQFMDKVSKNKIVNKIFSSSPFLKNFVVYTIFILQKDDYQNAQS